MSSPGMQEQWPGQGQGCGARLCRMRLERRPERDLVRPPQMAVGQERVVCGPGYWLSHSKCGRGF